MHAWMMDNPYCTIENKTDRDGTLICFLRMKSTDVTEEDWELVLKSVRSFLNHIEERRLMYHFFFDLSLLDNIPFMKIRELQEVLNSMRSILVAYLHSTVILTKSVAVKVLIDATFQVYPPVKHIEGILVDPYDIDVMDQRFGHTKRVTKEALQSMRRCRAENLRGGRDAAQ